jgi:beta-phosphoglucomutase-like phosphatase (HAD superfamily)
MASRDATVFGGAPLAECRHRLAQARSRGLRLAIGITTGHENVTRLLARTLGTDVINYFEAIGPGDRVPSKKPAPDVYNWV